MIIYNELASLEADLGYSAKQLYSLSNGINRHYHPAEIPKSDGGSRSLSVPDAQLKAVQSKIADRLLSLEDISVYATAYRPGGSIVRNALPHIGHSDVLKLDIRRFFDSITYPLIKEKAFPAKRYSEKNRILLAILCTYKEALPQGAPSSPAISNIILRDLDDAVGSWCRSRYITYTRYCDDMTFSGRISTALKKEIINTVEQQLRKAGLYLNADKTVFVHDGQRKCVTGIIVNEKVSIPAGYRRDIRQKMHYICSYGIKSHIQHTGSRLSEEEYLRKLLGRISFVLSIDPHNEEMIGYRSKLIEIRRTL